MKLHWTLMSLGTPIEDGAQLMRIRTQIGYVFQNGALFDSLSVERHNDRAVLTASVPAGFLKKIIAEPQQELVPQAGTTGNPEARAATPATPAASLPQKPH